MEDLYSAEPRPPDSLSFSPVHHHDRLLHVFSSASTVGYTVDEAVHSFVRLEKQCKVQLHTEAASSGSLQKTIIEEADAVYTANILQNPHLAYLGVRFFFKFLTRQYNEVCRSLVPG
jgi:hypothetical protein